MTIGNMKSNDFVISIRGTICVIESVKELLVPVLHLRALHTNYREGVRVNSEIVLPVGHVAYLEPESWQVRQITERFHGWLLARVGMLAYLHLQEQWPHMSCKTEVAFVGEQYMSICIPLPQRVQPTWLPDDMKTTDVHVCTINLDKFNYRRDEQSNIERLYIGYGEPVDTLAVRLVAPEYETLSTRYLKSLMMREKK